MFLKEAIQINSSNHMVFGGCDLVDIARKFGTPLYVYDEEHIRKCCQIYRQELEQSYPHGKVIYAGKAFLTTAMCRLIEQEGLGLDVVSGGELFTALQADFPASHIYFHGNNKSRDELEMAIESGVGRIVIDSMVELEMLEQIAVKKEKKVDILLRIRPGVETHTHHYIQTGREDSKFGLGLKDGQALAAIEAVIKAKALKLKGLHCHIGSQILDVEPFGLAAGIMVDFMQQIRQKTGIILPELDLGGGLGIRYQRRDKPADFKKYINAITVEIKKHATKYNFPLPRLLIEPGRSIVGEAGITLYTVGVIKDITDVRRYVAVDGGMMDNMRPLLYNARYEAVLANKCRLPAAGEVTIAGKACESGDILVENINLPPVETGDILAVLSTGAYHYSMASNYNRNPRPAVVFLRRGRADLVVNRESYRDLIKNDVIPEYLDKEQYKAIING